MDYTRKAGLFFLCSAFGMRSARMLREMKSGAIKIASPELNHLPLLREVAGYGLPLILSSGVSLVGDIDRALQVVGTENVALLHCVTAYPAPVADYNLRVMRGLESIFGVPVGVSDHSTDPVTVPALSAALGAAIIEKHLTLSKEGRGLDDPVALVPRDFHEMTVESRRARRNGIEETITRLSASTERDTLLRVLGTGNKRLAPSEEAAYSRTNRSLHAVTDLPAGTLLTGKNVAVLRTERKLRAGLSPFFFDSILGRRTVRKVPAGEGIVWDDLLSR
jgi:N-acetylneuraminate synthase